MRRLTYREPQTGKVHLHSQDANVIEKLAEYEDLEERCIKECGCGLNMVVVKHIEFLEHIHKLAEYWLLEEQGLLLMLPCKVGDTLYRIDTDKFIENTEIIPFTVEYIVICENGDIMFEYDDAYNGVICHLENIITDKPYLDYYRVFLTKEEAEAALEKMKGEKYATD